MGQHTIFRYLCFAGEFRWSGVSVHMAFSAPKHYVLMETRNKIYKAKPCCILQHGHILHVRIQKILSEGVQLWQHSFLVDARMEDPSTTISEPSSSRHWMAFCWRADDGPTLNAGLVAVIFRGSGPVLLENPIFLWFFRGGGVGSGTPAPLWIRTCIRGICANEISTKIICASSWAATGENLTSGCWEQHRRRPACASAQTDQRLCYSPFGKYHM